MRPQLTLLKLVWDPEVRAYNLKFTEMLNRNCAIDRAVHDGKPFDKLVPLGLPPPELKPRVVPDPDEDEYALEVGEDNAKVWCQIAGRWELGEVQGRRGVGHRRKLVVTVEGTEHEIDPKAVTQFEPSHAQDLPNMVRCLLLTGCLLLTRCPLLTCTLTLACTCSDG